MLPFVTLGFGAGIASALLFLAALVQPFVAFILMFAAPLPLYIVGLSNGGLAALFSALIGALVIGGLLGGIHGVWFLVTIGLAPIVLCKLALMSRPSPQQDAAGKARKDDVDWYPMGRLVLWAAVIAGTLVAGSMLLAGTGSEGYVEQALVLLQQIRDADPRIAEVFAQFDNDALEAYFRIVFRLVPIVAAAGWTLASIGNLWLAAKILEISGRSERPWRPFPKLDFPRPSVAALGVMLVGTLLPGSLGLIAEGYAAAFVTAFAILGLAVVHDVSRGFAGRIFVLTTGYLAFIMFNWLAALIFAALGIAETGFNIRARMNARASGGRST